MINFLIFFMPKSTCLYKFYPYLLQQSVNKHFNYYKTNVKMRYFTYLNTNVSLQTS